MNRDSTPPSTYDVVPPVPIGTFMKVMAAAVGAAALACGLGLVAYAFAEVPWPLSTARLVLVAGGVLTAAACLVNRPTVSWVWLGATGTLVLSVFGLPGHWDSIRFLAGVLAALAAVGTSLSAVPVAWRYRVVSAWLLFHFLGILCATTWPPPTPWVTDQVGTRVYMPYLSFTYLRNAYHFYSPDPGPSVEMIFLLTWDEDEIDPATGRKRENATWVTIPDRRTQYKDPLGMTYYRRLSITELASPTVSGPAMSPGFEKLEAEEARRKASLPTAREPFPLDPRNDPVDFQYQAPRPDLRHHIIPSYIRHIAAEYTTPNRPIKTVKMYRVQHRVVQPSQFLPHTAPNEQISPPRAALGEAAKVYDGMSPYDPVLYHPVFYGEYDAKTGDLLKPKDPMLYWLTPVAEKTGQVGKGEQNYDDFMSKHAGRVYDWERKSP